MLKNNISHVFFDLDNTIWNFKKNSEITLKQMFIENELTEKHGLDFLYWHQVYEEYNEILWKDLREKKITKEQLRDQRFKQTFAHFKIKNLQLSQIFEHDYLKKVTHQNHLVDGAKDLLDYLKPNYQLHILTNGFNEVSYRKIRGANIQSYFQTITTADEIGKLKPDPEIYAHCFAKSGAKKNESIYIGDDYVADIIGSRNFGIKSIFFNRFQEEIEDSQTIIVEKLSQIKKIL